MNRHAKETVGKTALLFIIGVIVVALLAFGIINLSGLKQGSVVNAVSTITYSSNTGEVRDGYLYGSKIVVLITATPDPAELIYTVAGKEQSWGNYKIFPQNNMRIKLSANPYADSPLELYRRSYFKNLWGQVYQTQDLKGSSWQVYTPLHLEIYADASYIPATAVLNKDISDSSISGQFLYPVGNGINIQRSSIVQTGTQGLYPAGDIVVATAPQFSEFKTAVPASSYPSTSQTYIFDRASYDSRIDYFYQNSGAAGRIFGGIVNPNLALWTGYDEYSWTGGLCGIFSDRYVNGYCKLIGWNGLYSEVNAPAYPVKYDPSYQKLIAQNIQYGAVVNLEIPSETLKSLAVLRGVGVPQVILTLTNAIRQGESAYLTVYVKNAGDNDGFSIVPASKSGKLLFTPASYSSQYIPYSTEKEFRFVVTVAGKETSELSAIEDVTVTVRADHNPVAVTKTTQVGITYPPMSETQPGVITGTPSSTPDISPGDADTMDLGNKTAGDKAERINWYDTTPAKILAGLISILIFLLIWRRTE
jgi:hypothetical protein